MKPQLAAVLVAAAAAAAFVLVAWLRSRLSAAAVDRATGFRPAEPEILYFSTAGCIACRVKQEPALKQLGTARVRKVDAVRESDLARRFRIYTVPSTVVLAPNGDVVDINYGFAPAKRLEAQLKKASESAYSSA